MAPEHRTIFDLAEVAAIRIDCASCGAAVALRPPVWRNETPQKCPGCGATWDLPTFDTLTPLQHVGTGLYLLGLRQQKAQNGTPPYRVRFEMKDDA